MDFFGITNKDSLGVSASAAAQGEKAGNGRSVAQDIRAVFSQLVSAGSKNGELTVKSAEATLFATTVSKIGRPEEPVRPKQDTRADDARAQAERADRPERAEPRDDDRELRESKDRDGRADGDAARDTDDSGFSDAETVVGQKIVKTEADVATEKPVGETAAIDSGIDTAAAGQDGEIADVDTTDGDDVQLDVALANTVADVDAENAAVKTETSAQPTETGTRSDAQTLAAVQAAAQAQANAGNTDAKATGKDAGPNKAAAVRPQADATAGQAVKPDQTGQANPDAAHLRSAADAAKSALKAEAKANPSAEQAAANRNQSQTPATAQEADLADTMQAEEPVEVKVKVRDTDASKAKGQAEAALKTERGAEQPQADATRTAAEPGIAAKAREAAVKAERAGQAPVRQDATAQAPAPVEEPPVAPLPQSHQPAAVKKGGDPAIRASAAEIASAPARTGAKGGDSSQAGLNQNQTDSRAAQKVQEAAAPPRRQPATQQAMIEQISVKVAKAAAQNADRISIQLRPKDLGRIEVKMELTKDGNLTARITADKADTLEMLKNDARSLERSLQDAGLKTDSNSLSFNLRGEGQFRNQLADDGQHGRGGPHGGDGSTGSGEDASMTPDEAPLGVNVAINGGIDMRV